MSNVGTPMMRDCGYVGTNDAAADFGASATDASAVSADRLIALKDSIEALSKIHQAEILRICTVRGVVGSENKNGVFINLSNVPTNTVVEIERYMAYVSTQETQLNEVELQKKELTTKYFT